MIDILIGVILLAVGYAAGRRQLPAAVTPPAVEAVEQVRVQEDRAAFQQLMGYNLDRAYGMADED